MGVEGARGGRGHVVVVGGGITGLSAAHRLLTSDPEVAVTLLEADDRWGGKIRTSPFAGLAAVDEAADAYLTRVPFAVDLARDLGLDGALANPSTGAAAVWHAGGLHPIPEGLVLGVPTGVGSLLRSGLLSTRGALRAGLEPLLPRTSTDHDSIGRWVRSRFGDQVHERLLDPLVGSIYAADTDRFSLATVPQLADLARHRSVLLGARRQRRATTPRSSAPVFEAPQAGMGHLVARLVAEIEQLGGALHTSCPVEGIEPTIGGYRVAAGGDVLEAGPIVLACPAPAAARLLAPVAPVPADVLREVTTASVVMVTMAIPADQWTLGRELSGYLVPKPEQRHVTAVSFASNKWAHWRPDDGSMLLRVSLGRDGLEVDHHDDAWLVDTAVSEVSRHLGATLSPTQVRLTRWPGAFPQYRPGHLSRLAAVERELAATAPAIALAGASHRGMGIPACIQQAHQAAAASLTALTRARD